MIWETQMPRGRAVKKHCAFLSSNPMRSMFRGSMPKADATSLTCKNWLNVELILLRETEIWRDPLEKISNRGNRE